MADHFGDHLRHDPLLVNSCDVTCGEVRAVSVTEQRQRGTSERLRQREAELQTLAQRVQPASKLAAQRGGSTPKVGRNDPCPCGSGKKYKKCCGR